MQNKRKLLNKRLSFWQALIPVVTMALFILLAVLAWDIPIHLALFFELVVTVLLALSWGYSWPQLEEMLFSSFKDIGHVILILLLIGMLIGVWIDSGTVPSLIFYGVQFLQPRFFLVLVFLITTIVSISIGTAVGTASTIGLALVSIAHGLGFPLPLVAGAIISGCYVGDRMSPVSSIANMTAFSAGVNIDEMVRHMVSTILPPFLLTLIIYLGIGLFFLPDTASTDQVTVLAAGLQRSFIISPLLLLPPLFIISLSLFRVPTIPNLVVSILLSLTLGVVISGKKGIHLLMSMYQGFQGNTGNGMLDTLLSRGGLTGMLELISLIILAVLLGGLFEELGVLESILRKLIQRIASKSSLLIITMASSIITAILSCNQLLAVYLPGRMMAARYDVMGVSRKDLARSLGDSGLIFSPMIPWNVNGLMMAGILGVKTTAYFPLAFLPLLLPVSAVLLSLLSKDKMEEK